MGVVVTVTAEPDMPLVVALHPTESPLTVFVVQMSQPKRQEPPALFAHPPGACSGVNAGFLLLCGGWLAPAESLAGADHASASRTVSTASPLITIAVVNLRTAHPLAAAVLYFRQSFTNPSPRL